MFKNSEKGVSLIITFFILVIILAVVLSISIILYSELKIIRNIGDSVVAFYAADSGVEKTLYYDRHGAPEGTPGSNRGICNICDNYETCISKTDLAEGGCNPVACENCEVKFYTDLLNGKNYTVTATVSQYSPVDNPSLKSSKLDIDSVGSYNSVAGADAVKRGIELISMKDETKSWLPEIKNPLINFKTQPFGDSIYISVEINAHGHGVKSVVAHIYSSTYAQDVYLLPLSGSYSDGIYITDPFVSGLPTGAYSVDITACDNNGNCTPPTAIYGI